MKSNSGYRVLIVGCGQLGSRHLQAVASLSMVTEIEVVDPSPEALELGRQRLAELPRDKSPSHVRWLASIGEATKQGDLCIIATQAQERCKALREVADTLGYSAFLLEKIVAQSIEELEASAGFATSRGLSVWVNFLERGIPFYRRVKERLSPVDPLIFSATGGNFFLATNGIHSVDLFAYYDECTRIEGAGARVDPILHPSKRGEGLYDLTGTLHGYTEKGSSLTISYIGADSPWFHISIASRGYRCFVDHGTGWACESDSESGWEWRKVPFEGSMLVSQTTREFATGILTSGHCALPTLEESLVSHRFILGQLQPHFCGLLGRPIDRCPVT